MPTEGEGKNKHTKGYILPLSWTSELHKNYSFCYLSVPAEVNWPWLALCAVMSVWQHVRGKQDMRCEKGAGSLFSVTIAGCVPLCAEGWCWLPVGAGEGGSVGMVWVWPSRKLHVQTHFVWQEIFCSSCALDLFARENQIMVFLEDIFNYCCIYNKTSVLKALII